MEGLTIGQVAKASNVNIETVRYYERRGLISIPPRNESGYRMFTQETVSNIQFIKSAQELGFSLVEVRELLARYKNDDCISTQEMYQLTLTKVQEIDAKINQLSKLKAILESVMKLPASDLPLPPNQCPVLQKCSEG
ncbi:MerR family transcriptional regulator [Paenibacillus sp. GCM10028914]|uniref:MerR family transcriptional regulator n=1 Tax=Paenibacillus sp. GCM10028914 TaxID=3273416 RepID=UPI00360CC330